MRRNERRHRYEWAREQDDPVVSKPEHELREDGEKAVVTPDLFDASDRVRHCAHAVHRAVESGDEG